MQDQHYDGIEFLPFREQSAKIIKALGPGCSDGNDPGRLLIRHFSSVPYPEIFFKRTIATAGI